MTKLAPFSWTDFVDHMRAERTGRNRNSRRVSSSIYPQCSHQFIYETLSQSSILARFQNYSKLEENPEECSVNSLDFASQHVPIPSVSKSTDAINIKDEKSGFSDLLGSLSEDPGLDINNTQDPKQYIVIVIFRIPQFSAPTDKRLWTMGRQLASHST